MNKKHRDFKAAHTVLQLFDLIYSGEAEQQRWPDSMALNTALDAWRTKYATAVYAGSMSVHDVIMGTESERVTSTEQVANAVANAQRNTRHLFTARDLMGLQGTTANEHFHWYINRRMLLITSIRPDHLDVLLLWYILCYNNSLRPKAKSMLLAAGRTEEEVACLDSMFLLSHNVPLYTSSSGPAPYIMLETRGLRHMDLGKLQVAGASAAAEVTATDRERLLEVIEQYRAGHLKFNLKQQQHLPSTLRSRYFPHLTAAQVAGMILAWRRQQQQQQQQQQELQQELQQEQQQVQHTTAQLSQDSVEQLERQHHQRFSRRGTVYAYIANGLRVDHCVDTFSSDDD